MGRLNSAGLPFGGSSDFGDVSYAQSLKLLAHFSLHMQAQLEMSPCRLVAACGGSDGGAPLALFCMCAACTHALSAITHVWPDSHSLVSLHTCCALSCSSIWVSLMYCWPLGGLTQSGECLHTGVPWPALARPACAYLSVVCGQT